MWYMKDFTLNLSETMTEEQMTEFWFELDKQKNNDIITYNDAVEIF